MAPERMTSTLWHRFCKNLVLGVLKRMDQGFLTLMLPNHSIIQIGTNPQSAFQATLRVNNDRFFSRIVLYGHVGVGEAYIDGDWETDDIAAVIRWAIYNLECSPLFEGSKGHSVALNVLGTLNRWFHRWRPNSLRQSRKNIREHYDLSNDFFALFLDPSMTYSSAKFDNTAIPQSLEDAQMAKYEALCQKLKLSASDHVLEIGTGWGSMAIYMARHYGCQVTTLTISEAQYQYASARIASENLGGQITLKQCDYRKIEGRFDKIVSIEMLEAVGDAYLDIFFRQCSQLLTPQGLLGIQFISCPDSRYALLRDNVDFIQKHIFPGSLLPSVGRINQALQRTSDLFLHSLEDMGNSYVKTLNVWQYNFNAQLQQVYALGFDDRFIRKWNYYLCYCQAAFAMRNITVVQALYTRPNNLLLSATVKEMPV